MAKKSLGNVLGAWAFLFGIIVALIIGLFTLKNDSWMIGLLVLAGVIVGLFNVTSKESMKFLLAGVSLVIVSGMGHSVLATFNVVNIAGVSISDKMSSVLAALLILFVPATIIVSLKSVFEIARD